MPMQSLSSSARAGWVAGLTAAVPMAVATFPFGLAYGVGVRAAGLNPFVGASASWTVLAGAAQLSMLSLMQEHASAIVVIAAGLVINARFALYSMALAPAFKDFPAPWRFALPYLMTDQVAALSLQHFAERADPVERRWYYLGTATGIVAAWWAGTLAGVFLGGAIPPSIDIAFTVPLVFVVLLVPSLIDRPSWAAAVVGAGVTAATASMPQGLNTLVGAAAGVAAGALAERWRRT